MNKYIGTKMIEAKEMIRGAYIKYCKTIPECENPADDGYLIKYSDGCEGWLPKKQFEETYRDCMGMNFGIALELMKKGCKVAREDWNSKGMFAVYQKGYPDGIPCNRQTAEAWGMKEGELFKCNPYLQVRQADGSHSMWVPSVDDVLAEDWVIVE